MFVAEGDQESGGLGLFVVAPHFSSLQRSSGWRLPTCPSCPPCVQHRASQIGARVVSHGRTCLAVVGDGTSGQAERCLFELRKVRRDS